MSQSNLGNLFKDLPSHLTEELVETIIEHSNVRIERIVSTGQSSPADCWYDQDEHEWVVVLQGAAAVMFEGETSPIHLVPGDHLSIAAHQRHRVTWTSSEAPTVWLAVFYR
jgi:cupin 2 domain-containing protein